jgi:hypothetical protein
MPPTDDEHGSEELDEALLEGISWHLLGPMSGAAHEIWDHSMLSLLVAEVRRLRPDPYAFMPMLTDKELETIDALIRVAIPMTDCKSDKAPPQAFARLISEHRRLRSDDWLQAAAVEAVSGGELARLQPDAMIAILRKHRDGKA